VSVRGTNASAARSGAPSLHLDVDLEARACGPRRMTGRGARPGLNALELALALRSLPGLAVRTTKMWRAAVGCRVLPDGLAIAASAASGWCWSGFDCLCGRAPHPISVLFADRLVEGDNVVNSLPSSMPNRSQKTARTASRVDHVRAHIGKMFGKSLLPDVMSGDFGAGRAKCRISSSDVVAALQKDIAGQGPWAWDRSALESDAGLAVGLREDEAVFLVERDFHREPVLDATQGRELPAEQGCVRGVEEGA